MKITAEQVIDYASTGPLAEVRVVAGLFQAAVDKRRKPKRAARKKSETPDNPSDRA